MTMTRRRQNHAKHRTLRRPRSVRERRSARSKKRRTLHRQKRRRDIRRRTRRKKGGMFGRITGMFASAPVPQSIDNIINSFAASIKPNTSKSDILRLAGNALRKLCNNGTPCRGTLPCNKAFFRQAQNLVEEAVNQIMGFLLAAQVREDELSVSPGTEHDPKKLERMLLIEVVKQTLRLICAAGLPGLESQLVAQDAQDDTVKSIEQYIIIEAQRAEAAGGELEIPTNSQPLQEAIQEDMAEFHKRAFVQSVAIYYYRIRSYAPLLIVHEEGGGEVIYPLYQVATIRNQLDGIIEASKYDTLTNDNHMGAIIRFEAGVASAAETPQEFPQRLAAISAEITEGIRVAAGYSAGNVPDAFANITLVIPKPWPKNPRVVRMNPALWCGLYLGKVGTDPELASVWNYIKATRDKDLFSAATPQEKIKLLGMVSEAVASANAIEQLIGTVMAESGHDRETLARELLSYLKNESEMPQEESIGELIDRYKGIISGMVGTGFPNDEQTGLPFGLLSFPEDPDFHSPLPVYISFADPGIHVLLGNNILNNHLEPGLPLYAPGTDCWNAQVQAQEMARLLQGLSAYNATDWYSNINQLLISAAPEKQNPNAWNPLAKTGEREGVAFPFPVSWYTLGFKEDGTPFTARADGTDCPASTLYGTFEGFFLTMYQGMNVDNLSELRDRARAAVASATPLPRPCIGSDNVRIDRRFVVSAKSEPGFDNSRSPVKDAWRVASVSHAAWTFWTREKGDAKENELLDKWVDTWKKKRDSIIRDADASAQGAPAPPSGPTLPAVETATDAGASGQGVLVPR